MDIDDDYISYILSQRRKCSSADNIVINAAVIYSAVRSGGPQKQPGLVAAARGRSHLLRGR